MSLLGGVASPIGSAIGTGLLILIPEWLRFLKSVPGLYLAIYGLAVILIIRYMGFKLVTLSNESGLMMTYAKMQVNQTRKESAGKA